MSTSLRLLLLAALTLWPTTHHPAARLSIASDAALVARASSMLGHVSVQRVVGYLRRRGVQSAVLGLDGKTVNVTFQDGARGAILPAGPLPVAARAATPAPLAAPLSSGSRHSAIPSRAAQLKSRLQNSADVRPRALVLEPFDTELQLGVHPDDQLIGWLTQLGYQVDQLYDTDVTVDTMSTLSRYDLVYINTHSGVNPQGEGVLATGQPADPNHPDPSLEPLIKEYSLLIVGVAGTDQAYYGIISGYIRRYADSFRPGALVFINGCTFLRATAFWSALHEKGVGAMISWSDDVAPKPAVLASKVVAADLSHGASVSRSVADVMAEAYAMTNASGGPAHLGFLGDGTLTIPPFSSRASPPPPPTPTVAPPPSASPTSTPPPLSALPPGSWHAPPADRVHPSCMTSLWGRGRPC